MPCPATAAGLPERIEVVDVLRGFALFGILFTHISMQFVAGMLPETVMQAVSGHPADQVQYSKWWLSRFRYGPLEWLWRSGTYLRVQPFRRPAVPKAEVA